MILIYQVGSMHFYAFLKHSWSKILNDLKYDDELFVDDEFQVDSGLFQIQMANR